MKVYVKGGGEVALAQTNFVAQGGQAAVYQKNGTAYKVYLDKKDAVPEAKFRALSRIADPQVVKPDALLVDPKGGEPLGYTMRFVGENYSLAQLFTKAFCERNGVTRDKARALVGELQGHVERIHAADAVIVDLNELNVLVAKDLSSLWMIDVDSYAVAGYPAEVIMPSVRDWSVRGNQFSALSDWFSFAVLAFQLYVGAHPYRGGHAATASLPPESRLEARMKQNLSALGPGVKLPGGCYPLDGIPALQRAWMFAVLQEGKRLPPPDPNAVAPVIAATMTLQSAVIFGGSLVVTQYAEFDEDVLDFVESGNHAIALTKGAVYLDGRKTLPRSNQSGTTLIGFVAKTNEPVALKLDGAALLVVTVADKKTTAVRSEAREIARSDGRFYARAREYIHELELIGTTAGAQCFPHPVASVMEHSTGLFEGCAIQNMVGSVFVSLFEKSRQGRQVRIPELDRYKIVDTKFEGGVMMVVGARDGRYDRLVFRFEGGEYDLRTIEGVPGGALNFVTTATGVCVALVEDDRLEVFMAAKGARGVRVVEDPALSSDMRLMHVGGGVGFARGKCVYTMRLK